jgi:hypothetical protein
MKKQVVVEGQKERKGSEKELQIQSIVIATTIYLFLLSKRRQLRVFSNAVLS